jgi:response regulator RpfG family c-di-GMP phosphodiesterase
MGHTRSIPGDFVHDNRQKTGLTMADRQPHTVLIADDDLSVYQSIRRIIEPQNLRTLYADSGMSGLETIRQNPSLLSMIISNHRMPDMKGTDFLEQARDICPNTIRFLITGNPDMETIIQAVNRGAVHRYLTKPWEADQLLAIVRDGIGIYESFLEKDRILRLARQQRTQLYALSQKLMKTSEKRNQELAALDLEISSLEARLSTVDQPPFPSPVLMLSQLLQLIPEPSQEGQVILNQLYTATIQTLRDAFHDLAANNGFELPETIAGASDESP